MHSLRGGALVAPKRVTPMYLASLCAEYPMELDTLQALYVDKLRDLYSAENQILKALPMVIKKVTNEELREALQTHHTQTEQHVQRLEQLFGEMGESPKGKHCKGMEGLLAEASELMGEDAQEDVMDAGLIAAAQAVEHYEMAGYGSARTYADLLGLSDHVDLLQQTLNEEGEADRILNEVAMTSVNLGALESGSGADDESPMAPAPKTRSSSGAKATGRKGRG